MLKFKNYVRPQSLEEAFALNQKRSSVVLGGMLWLNLQNKTVDTAIDLCGLGLDTIEEIETEYRIGAMVTLRALETHPGLQTLTGGALGACLSPIVGVQFRNLATIGGSIRGKFGFSDPLTLLLALEAEVEFYQKGRLPLEQWLDQPSDRDILTAVILKKRPIRVDYRSVRNSATDFPVLTCAVCQSEQGVLCSVGARPGTAILYRDRMDLLADRITEEKAADFAEEAAAYMTFGSNLRGSAEYRRKLAKVLVKRGLLAIGEGN